LITARRWTVTEREAALEPGEVALDGFDAQAAREATGALDRELTEPPVNPGGKATAGARTAQEASVAPEGVESVATEPAEDARESDVTGDSNSRVDAFWQEVEGGSPTHG